MGTRLGRGADQGEFAGVLWVVDGVGHGHSATERRAVDDGILNLQRLAEGKHVVGPLAQGPGVWGSAVASAIAAVVQVDHLCNIRKLRKRRLV